MFRHAAKEAGLENGCEKKPRFLGFLKSPKTSKVQNLGF